MTGKAEIERHLPFVRRIAGRIKGTLGPPLALDDLVSYGVVGLGDALARYRPELGVPFESFAYHRVRGAMLEGISRQCPLTRHEYRNLRLKQKANDVMEGVSADLGGGTARTAETDASMISTTVRDLASVYTLARLARTYEDDAVQADYADPSAEEAHEKRVSTRELGRFLGRLPEDQARLLSLYYFEDRTLEEAGRIMGFKKSWACKLHRAALARLREMMASEFD